MKRTITPAEIARIGTIVVGTFSSSVSCQNETATQIGTISLSKGQWIIVACADWQSNSNGTRQISRSSGVNPSPRLAVTTNPASGSKETYQQIVNIDNITVETTIAFYGYQSSGSTISVYPYIYAIMINY